jgi:hypothetical protein
MKLLEMIFKLCVSYFIGSSVVVLANVLMGDNLYVIMRFLLDWLPVSIVYGALAAAALYRFRLQNIFGMVGLCGFWIGMLPLLFSWPPYMCILMLAIVSIFVQCVSIAVVVLLRWGVFKLSHK